MRICLCPRAEPESEPEPDIPIQLNSSLQLPRPTVHATMRQGQKSSNCESGSKDIRICSVCPTAIRFRASSYYSNNNWTKPSWVEKNIPRLATLLIVLSLAQPRPRHDATCTGIITAHPATCANAAATASTTALTTAPPAVRKLPIAEIIKAHKCEPRAVCVRQQKYFN